MEFYAMVQLARSTFDIGPADDVKMVDVYNVTDSSVRNALTSKLGTFGDSLTDIYGKSTQVLTGIKDKFLKGDINLEDAKRRITGALTGSRTDITYLSTKLQNAIFTDVTGKDGGTNYVRQANELINTVQVVTTRGKQVFQNTNHNQVGAIMRFVSDLTGNSVFKMLDIGAEAALVKGAITEIGKWGVPSLVDDVLDKTDPMVARSAVRRAANEMSSTTDLDTIKVMIARVGAQTLTAETPTFATNLITRYRFKEGVTPEKYPALLADLVSVMDQLQPNWFYTQRAAEEVANLAVIQTASDDAVTLLASDERYLKHVITAPFYATKSSRVLLKTLYPYIAIS